MISYFLLGTNMGNRMKALELAVNLLRNRFGKPYAVSMVYETAAWGKTDQQDFLNMAIGFHMEDDPEALLDITQQMESDLGRTRTEKWGPRVIDIDLLLMGSMVFQSERLQIPHPMMPQRRFTLLPLAEIAGNVRHPILNKTIKELLEICPDEGAVNRVGRLCL
ncbi:MAG: 2-amino-4-hydroxy-6-hydroxymethyldihydropteridine diphosphokinase [Chitinophagales bacterium]